MIKKIQIGLKKATENHAFSDRASARARKEIIEGACALCMCHYDLCTAEDAKAFISCEKSNFADAIRLAVEACKIIEAEA